MSDRHLPGSQALGHARAVDPDRCYRCLERYPVEALSDAAAPCGCTERYCPDCLRSPRLWAFLGFLARSCRRSVEQESAA
jgi:hypothetical protein